MAAVVPLEVERTAGPSRAAPFVQLTATRAHLRQLFWARNAVLGAALAFIAADAALRSAPAPHAAEVILIGLAVLVNALTAWRLRQPRPVSHREFLLQVLVDVAFIASALLHLSDGASLAALNYIPLTVAAATLPGALTAAVFAIVVLLHEIVCHVLPGALWPDPWDRRVDLLVGGVLTFFVYCMARTSRAHEAIIAGVRERYMRERHAADLGTLAASMAHRLGSPLATLAVAVGELRAALGERGAHRRALELMESQIRACKEISSEALVSTGHGRAESGGKIAADRFIGGMVEKYTLMQPWTAVELRHEGRHPVPEILADAALEEAILVLLFEVSGARRSIRVAHRWDDASLRLEIRGGEPDRLEEHADVLLAKNTISRFGGTIAAVAEPGGGSCVEISLPLERLTI